MADLTGMDIYKQLPKTNCGDCNFPTCMAFAMQLANKQVSLDQCPHVTEEAEQALASAAAPPMKTVTLGEGENAVEVGGETVLFRHEEKFHRPAAVAVKIPDDIEDQQLSQRVEKVNHLIFERIGEKIGVDMIAIVHQSQEEEDFSRAVKTVSEKADFPLMLVSEKPSAIETVLDACETTPALICGADGSNWKEMSSLADQSKCPLTIKGENLQQLTDLSQKVEQAGVDDIVLQPLSSILSQNLEQLTKIRRLALKEKFRPLGYPVLCDFSDSKQFQTVGDITTQILKYGSIVLTDMIEPEFILPPLTARQHIYIDPQVQNSVEARLYEVGQPGPKSPVLFTTNFTLTYFSVENEVDNSGYSAYISTMDTEGLGVLNAYADDKLSGETIATAVKEQGVIDNIDHNKLIIPGLLAMLRMSIQENSDWEVIVGPEDAASIPRFLRQEWDESGS